jgi:hypothetical protein
MIRNYHFRFEELVIDQKEIVDKLGYNNHPLPSPFDVYLEDALRFAVDLNEIKGTCLICENVVVNVARKTIFAGGQELNVGKTVCKELEGSDRLFIFVCTAGKTISEKSAKLLKGEDPVLGYIFDVLGSAIVEAAADRMQNLLQQEIKIEGHNITNRYSPGYCNWHVSEQHKLFSLFDGIASDVTLTPSALMQPIKSISGIIGIGPDVKFREYQCELCTSKNCVYRKNL